jgi:hypothetical protein
MADLYSDKPLLDKLGVRPGMRVALVDVPDGDFGSLVGERAADLTEGAPRPATDLVFFGVESVAALAHLPELRRQLVPDGAIWVVSRKGKLATVRYEDVLAAALASDLVDNKVVSFSATHTALRLVIPRALRPAKR